MSMNTIYLEGISLIGPGLPNWSDAQPVLRGEQPIDMAPVVMPVAELLPATERRRAGSAIRLSMAIGLGAARAAGRDPATLANIFSSTGGDCENCHSLLDTLASDDRMISPTRFHNSVHNAAAGYWGIATHCTAASTSLCTYDATFGAALLETACQALSSGQPCLLIAFDTAYPEPLYSLRPIPWPFGVGMVLSPMQTAAHQPSLRLSLCQEPADTLAHSDLESLRLQVPSARSLPLLQRLARGGSGRVVIDYLAETSLAIEVAA
ncbi:beta-ketoacyl synthase chain length factor [Paludibacterium sp. THUN1379]|uniref:beta-ketoacyl synthase chain length factor n=1 Tax=Paludibacterium sp. THUN1379 TaxID=3112107 RepID=UPI0030863126|nr:beta-ketoacyl synthase chain length factor [Paludibacterium sp. THUN1379]